MIIGRSVDPAGDQSVDAVITWVDGSDPVHAEKRRWYAVREEGARLEPGGLADTRFLSTFELWYCVRLILRNAPWIRKVYIVTDNQCPAWIYGSDYLRDRVSVVDHREVFEGLAGALPTFSSLSIESVLHRIPGLAERYIYFNDDVLLVRPTNVLDWFDGSRPRWRGAWQATKGVSGYLSKAYERLRKIASPVRYRGGLVGFRAERDILCEHRTLFRIGHAPFPMTKSMARRYLEGRGLMKKNIGYRFRHRDQFNPAALMANLSLTDGLAVAGPKDWGYVAFGVNDELATRRLRYLMAEPPLSICLQSLDQSTRGQQEDVRVLLDGILRRASSA